ncbi:MAG: hypothetical protein Q8Q09_14660 [Deltaproteobacteria bacterium]|nr:hypothetical protein [Deltaproteobacteria bacterium]
MSARPQGLKTALRWGATLAIAGGLSYGGVRVTERWRAQASARVLMTDWAAFEGCVMAGASVPDAELVPRATALARGTGDPLWPHSCARALTRLATASAAIATENPSAAPLKDAASAMESALGEAVFWTRALQARRVTPGSWLTAFSTLRREVRAWAQRSQLVVPAPTPFVPARLPRLETDVELPPPPEALAGGDEADILDAIFTETHAAWILRDRRSRYSRCVLPFEATPSSVSCAPLTLGPLGDTRDLAWIASDHTPYLVGATRPPSDVRVVMDGLQFGTRITVRGMSEGHRDFIARRDHVIGIDRTRFGLTVRHSVGAFELPLPRDADVTSSDRALGLNGDPFIYTWIHPHRAQATSLHWLEVGSTRGGNLRLPGRWDSFDRKLSRCIRNGHTWWLADDGVGHTTVLESHGAGIAPVTTLALSVSAVTVRCSEGALSLFRAENSQLIETQCTASTCSTEAPLPIAEPWDADRGDTHRWVVDAGGPEGSLRVRTRNAATVANIRTIETRPAMAAPRGLRVLVRGERAVVLSRADRLHVLLGSTGAASLTPAALATDAVAPPLPTRR